MRETSARAGAFDLDTPTSEGSWEAALHAAGGACALAEALLGGGERVGFSALRPPGHHAEHARAMGFCLFANVGDRGAPRARLARRRAGAGPRLGRAPRQRHQRDLPRVAARCCSRASTSTRSGRAPGRCRTSAPGRARATRSTCRCRAGSGEDEFCGLVEHVVLPAARAFDPDLVLVSAGFDAHRDDPLGGARFETGSYAQLARQVLTLGKPVGYVLEGGYDLDALAASVAASMESLAGGGEPASHPRGELVEQAAAVLGRYWEV